MSAREELSDREVEVLELVAKGLRNRAVASELYIGTETVKSHLKSIFRKLGVASRSEAAAVLLSARAHDRAAG